ncbi:N-acetylglucosamine-6-phosphate deacetylase [Tropicimonas isoalkanivorans]|uniref:N-acetylglucosamine 6-phosphate deacetylase n=1 Tax=Tropicimonas isoalkanivorans TaxID=441112 RepID=A0A1I1DCM5_9RHOB|nr:N-acetylglucosamine-6-phosphate deacetylase [Tropicimonas isoalkanivorans]SFB72749.1 N-acetylglucosamine 6-phosphate deacetylase [Tropicimonas isoalkanivorans]
MTDARTLYRGGPIFDGDRLLEDSVLVLEDGHVADILPEAEAPDGTVADLEGDILSPGYVDLQVNGGGGVMFNDDQSVSALRRMAEAHASLGATTIFPTLITDTPDRTLAAIAGVEAAVAEGVEGIGGLHLEGPHLSLARKGAHDPSLIRSMTDRDLDILCDAARRLPALMVTVAPENATEDQVRTLAEAGAIVSLGHSDTDFDTARRYAAAGARCVTHLFNAMSQLGHRTPGLAGAALADGGLDCGLIADGIHVHPAAMRTAIAAKSGPGQIFLVSDSMAPAGTDDRSFTLNGRTIERADGRLLLADGTLAGADLDLTTAVNVLVEKVGLDLTQALCMATSVPAGVGRQRPGVGRLVSGAACPLIRLRRGAAGLSLVGTLLP